MGKIAKVIEIDKIKDIVKSNSTLMIGGFLGVGEPIKILDYISEQKEIKNLTVMSAVSGRVGGNFGLGKLAANKQIKKYIGSHIGTDPAIQKQYLSKEIEVELNPMGTFIERVRAGGAGLGAIITSVGIGIEEVEKVAAEKRGFFGKDYLVFSPLRAKIAIVKAIKADKLGNLKYEGASINSNPTMAMAADIVIAEVDEIVEIGNILPNEVGTPGIFVDYIVKGYTQQERKKIFGEYWEKMHWFNKEEENI